MTPERIVAIGLALAVLFGWIRLGLWQRRAGDNGAARWRLALLWALQPLVAGALFLTLFPPGVIVRDDLLVVATGGTPALTTAPGRLITLPEAPRRDGALAFPDLGSALRRFPATRRLRVLGQGLAARDIDSARGLSIAFEQPPAPSGIVALAPPGPVAAGAEFRLAGRANAADGARVELIDPAGRVTDRQPLPPGGQFTLSGTARTAGTTLFALRLRTAGGALLEEAPVPVLVTAAARPRLLLLAGAPGPEVKYLRRWATDAGFAVQAQIAAGGGVALGDPPIALSAANLQRFDVAIVDARAWASLGGGRTALLGAVRGGLGLLVRADGESETRALWRELGLPLGSGTGLQPVTLPGGAADTALARTRTGISGRDALAEPDADYQPEISRFAGTWQGRDIVPMLADAGGHPLAAWRPLGTGRVGAFAVVDSYALTLSGQADLFAQWWSQLLAPVARAGGTPGLIAGPFWTGERASLCGVGQAGGIQQPDGTKLRFLADRGAGGCAAIWPAQSGWHRMQAGSDARAFFVTPASALPAIKALRDSRATLQLAMTLPPPGEAARGTHQPGSPWPWFALWLLGSVALWTLERARRGRIGSARDQ